MAIISSLLCPHVVFAFFCAVSWTRCKVSRKVRSAPDSRCAVCRLQVDAAMTEPDQTTEVSVSNAYCVVYRLENADWKVTGEGWSQVT